MTTDEMRAKLYELINNANPQQLIGIDIIVRNCLEGKKFSHQSKTTDWWDNTSDEEQAEINEGLTQADRGGVVPHSEVMAKYINQIKPIK